MRLAHLPVHTCVSVNKARLKYTVDVWPGDALDQNLGDAGDTFVCSEVPVAASKSDQARIVSHFCSNMVGVNLAPFWASLAALVVLIVFLALCLS